MITKKITMFAVMMAAAVIFAAPTVTDVVAKQRYPWNGLVDITCTVSGIEGTTNGIYLSVAAVPETGDAIKGSRLWMTQNGATSANLYVCTNGNYRLLWDAQADLGQVIHSNMVVRVALKSHDKVQLWDGGPYWATVNIGADEPWESGYYFWWGDTVGYKRVGDHGVATDGSSSDFSFSEENTPTYGKNIDTLKNEGWTTADGVLTPEHDAAHVQWGGSWRMPTLQELEELNNKCDWIWMTTNRVNGYVIRGRGEYASDSIFLPAAGCVGIKFQLPGGCYWSIIASSYGNNNSFGTSFTSSKHATSSGYRRYYGFSVRPVQGFNE